MHQYNVGAPFEKISINVVEPFLQSNQGNRYLLVATDYFIKWPEAYTIPNQEASMSEEPYFLLTELALLCILL
jgi:hypothetical protein